MYMCTTESGGLKSTVYFHCYQKLSLKCAVALSFKISVVEMTVKLNKIHL